jgi:BirA family biotin operon repressor/biotin-[acetyl-CoA-carboxylase] ligase
VAWDQAELGAALEARREALGALATHWRLLEQTTSTNDEALRWAASGAPEGAWVAAREQTKGRGRRGRTWISPRGAGLYVSVVFRPSPTVSPAADAATPLITLMAGVAAVDAVASATGVRATLEWPNDLAIAAPDPAAGVAARKLAGILAEAASGGGRIAAVVVGIGINLRPAAYPPDVAARAVAIEEVSGTPPDANRLLVALLESLATWRRTLVSPGGPARLLAAWRAFAPSSVGALVRWVDGSQVREGRTAGIDETGALLVDTTAGRVRLTAGDVRWA